MTNRATRRFLLAALPGIGFLAACAESATQVPNQAQPATTTGATTQPTTAPPAVATATSVPAATAAPAAPAVAGGPLRFALTPGQSEARFRAQEQLVGRNLPNEAIGKTKDVSGAVAITAQGAIVADQSKVTVDLRTLRSDDGQRDRFIQGNTLQTQRFPNADFVAKSASGIPQPLPTSGEVKFQLMGDLTVRGVTKPAMWEVVATVTGQQLAGTAITRVKMTDFGMTPPRVGPVLSIEDELTLELEFAASGAA